ENDKEDVEQKNGAGGVEGLRPDIQSEQPEAVEGSKGKFSQQNRVGVQVHISSVARDQDDGNAENGGEDQPDSGVLAHQAGTVEQLHQADGNHTHQRRTDHQERRGEAASEE